LEADLLEQCMVTRVGMEKVEARLILHIDDPGRARPVALPYEL